MTKPKRYGLERQHTRRNARDFVDYDYLSKLTEAELDWLQQFNTEYYQNSFAADKNHKKLHRKGKSRQRCYDAENARNRDVWNQMSRLDDSVEELLDPEADE